MDAQQWRRIEEIFMQAAELPRAEQNGFLDAVCGQDLELRTEVESLLAAEAEAQDNLEAAIVGAARGLEPGLYQSDVGRRIGQYELIREIGRGGMGAVFMAVRSDRQFEHAVAIKLVRRGMDSEFILSRFLQERRILASLNHPNIAAIIDGGTTDDERPYFVMEYIEGLPIVEYCEAHQVPIPERLEIFRQVCSAVHYAHQKLVIHRDLKPGNILVMANGIPKLLDFGISKLLAPGTDTDNPVTMTSVRLMTPDYASPEQVRGDEITTASDVYSLGALLYELLTGRRPYTVTGRSTSEIEQAVCLQDPPRPSEAEQTPDRVRKELEGDLDNIILMAMRKEPERRYSSAEALSEDLLRYLKGLPVSARRDTLRYRMGKLIRRNRGSVIAAGLVFVSLLGGLWSTYYQMRRAESRFQQVRHLANAFLFDIDDKIRNLPGALSAREALVETSLKYLDSLAAEASSDASLQRELAGAYIKVGDVEGHVLTSNLGRTADAIESYKKAIALMAPLHQRDSRDAQAQKILIQAHGRLGDNLSYTGDLKQAVSHYREGIQLSEEALKATPDDAPTLRELSKLYRQLASIEQRNAAPDALGHARRSAEVIARAASVDPASVETRSEMATSLSQLGSIMMRRNDLKGALDAYERSRDITRMLLKRDPDSVQLQRDLMIVHGHIGDILGSPTRANLGDLRGALDSYGEMLRLAKGLAKDRRDKRSENDLAVALMRMANAVPRESANEAVQMFREAAGIMEAAAASDPKNLRNRLNLGFTLGRLGARLMEAGKMDEARGVFQQGLKLSAELLAANTQEADVARTALGFYQEYVDFAIRAGKPQLADGVVRKSLEMAGSMSGKKGAGLYEAVWLPRVYEWMGDLEHAKRSGSRECDWYRKAQSEWEGLRGRYKLPVNQEKEAQELERKFSGCPVDASSPRMLSKSTPKAP
jgi:eukaryotic-like serine/threonine-protein kinase